MENLPEYWIQAYRRARGVSYAGFGKRDAVILHRLAKDYGEASLLWIIRRYLAIEDDPMVRRMGWDTRGLASRARSLYIDLVRRHGEAAVAEANERRAALKAAPQQVLSLVDRIGRKA